MRDFFSSLQAAEQGIQSCDLQNLRDEAKSPCVSWIVEFYNKDFELSNYIGLLGQDLFGNVIIFM